MFLLFFVIFSVSGCGNNHIEVSNDYFGDFLEVYDTEDVVSNFKKYVQAIRGFNFEGKVRIKDKEYVVDGKIISRGTIDKSIVSINYGDNYLYINEGVVTIGYIHKGMEIVVKDTLDNFVEEVVETLESKGVNCNKDKIYDVIRNKTIQDLNFEELTKWIVIDEGYSFRYKDLLVELNDNYLPESLNFNYNDISFSVSLNYDNVVINEKNKFNFIVLSIKEIKEFLNIKNISDLFN